MIALSTTRRGAACVRRRQASPASAAGAVRAARSAAVPVANGAATAAVAAGSADEDGCRRLGARAPAAHSTVCAQRAASRGRRGGGPGRQRCGARDVGSEKLARRAASRARGRRARGAVQELRVCPPASGETMRAETPERTGTERTRGRAGFHGQAARSWRLSNRGKWSAQLQERHFPGGILTGQDRLAQADSTGVINCVPTSEARLGRLPRREPRIMRRHATNGLHPHTW